MKWISKSLLTLGLIGFTLGIFFHFHPVLANDQSDFSHETFSELLKTYVDDKGRVDYQKLKNHGQKQLQDYIRKFAQIKPSTLKSFSREEKLAFYINAYNAFTLKLIVDHYPISSIRNIPDLSGLTGMGQWKKELWIIAGKKISLDAIEHKVLRPMGEPRIHFALVCASIGCPNLPQVAFTPQNLETLLDQQAIIYNTSKKGVQIQNGKDPTLRISKIYDWFKKDFLVSAADIPSFIARLSNPEIKAFIENHKDTLDIEYIDYNWDLNDQK